jgi:hypothetical protein
MLGTGLSFASVFRHLFVALGQPTTIETVVISFDDPLLVLH